MQRNSLVKKGSFADGCVGGVGGTSGVVPEVLGGDQNSIISEEDPPPEPLELTFPKTWKARVMFLITLPILATFSFTIPDVRRPNRRALYLVTFAFSMGYIALLSLYMVKWAAYLASHMGVRVLLNHTTNYLQNKLDNLTIYKANYLPA